MYNTPTLNTDFLKEDPGKVDNTLVVAQGTNQYMPLILDINLELEITRSITAQAGFGGLSKGTI